ncbi:MAG TPA: GNAT family N-acetyltransferase [Mycobacteriales bacterium]|nr:GNAT family N-acetyltransferase [Mycobacteriales bacterium]
MGYPAHWEADAVLADGGIVHLRPIRPDDADRLREFHARLSPETVYNRFFTMMRALPARDVERFTTVDHEERAAVVALLQGRIVGVCRYDRYPGTTGGEVTAEVAIVVEDGHQGRGLGPLLLEHLTAYARERGIERFSASVLPSNRRMLTVFRSAGFEVERELADGYVELSYPIGVTDASLEVMRSREHRAEARSVHRLLSPKAVAVVGASREPDTVGHEVFRSLLLHGFEGPVYPVNPAAPHVASVRAWADVRDVPDDVDLAVVALPAPLVADAVRACAEKRVRGLVVVSGGFGEAGEEGRQRLAEVVRLARDGGMRLIGPNAMGIVNTDPAVRLHATFAPGSPPPGRVGVFSQSGALAGTVLAEATRRALGLSTFVSIGDRADVSGNDLLQYWEDDERTDVVLMHLQGFGNPRKFARIARRVGRSKPVVALKSGRGAGDAAVDALFASAGVVRADTLGQLFETAQLLALQPLPAGRRVGIVGTSSALAAMATDACRSVGLKVPELPEPVRQGLRGLGSATDTSNPVDLGPLAPPGQLGTALRLVAGSGEVDALLVLVTPHPQQDRMAAELLAVSEGSELPVLASFLGHDGVLPQLSLAPDGEAPGRGSVPSWSSPESAALALARAADHAAWRSRAAGTVPELPGFDGEAVRVAVAGLPLDGAWLPADVTSRLLAAAGLRLWPAERVRTLDEACAAARRLGWPVGLKSADERWRNRTDVGAVRLDLDDEDELVEAWRSIEPFVEQEGAFVQPMAPGGVSTVLRLVEDPAVGPLLSLRLGGVAADLLADPVTRTAPLTDVEAEELVHAVRGVSLLRGTDVAALEDVVLRVARLAEEVREVGEVLLDPVLVGYEGVTLLHAGVRLLPPGVDPERGPRRLVDLRSF